MLSALSIILLFVPFVALFLTFQRGDADWRRSVLSAALVWGTLLTVITEVLSAFALLNQFWLRVVWGGLSLLSLFKFFQPNKGLSTFGDFKPSLRARLKNLGQLVRSHSDRQLLVLVVLSLGCILSLTGLIAIVAPPNTYNTMTYHLPRVMHWLQNQSVRHFPTHIPRQIDPPPWFSFVLLHLQALSGGDRFANLVQWSSMVGCLLGTSLIARQLGANLAGQLLTVMICASIPMGLLQSATSQNDYGVAFWLVCFTCNALFMLEGEKTLRARLELGSSLGLAILTKVTAYIYALPIGVLWLFHFRHEVRAGQWSKLMAGAIPILLLNGFHWTRNLRAFHNPLGISGFVARNGLFTPAAILSNLIRNIALHLPIAFQPVNDAIEQGIIFIHRHILRLYINDPRTTYVNTSFNLPIHFQLDQIYLNEETSGNFFHLLLIFAAITLYIRQREHRSWLLTQYLVSLLGMALLFSTLLAWQPWASRLHLPLFVLASPGLGLVLSRVLRRKFWVWVLVLGLFISSVPYLLFSAPRPIARSPLFLTHIPSIFQQTRLEGYFAIFSRFYQPYVSAIDLALAHQCRHLGLYTSDDSWEYPFWAVAQAKSPQLPLKFRAVNVDNPSKNLDLSPAEKFTPCAILAMERENLDASLTVNDRGTEQPIIYHKAADFKIVKVYRPNRLSSTAY